MVFQFEMSDKSVNEEHSENKLDIFIALLKFHFEIFLKCFKEEHPANIKEIFFT